MWGWRGGGGHVVGCSISLCRSRVCSCCLGRIIAELLMPYCGRGRGWVRVGSGDWECRGAGACSWM